MQMTSIFSFSNNIFNLIKELLNDLRQVEIVVCKWFEFGTI